MEGLENCPPRNELEEALAKAKGFLPNVRLACQTIPTGEVHLRRLVIDDEDVELAKEQGANGFGKEKEVAILFSDIRGFTSFAESNLPYDVIHILNRYFKQIGEVILKNKGYIDKYIGDGIMAIFGLEDGEEANEICFQAVQSALLMLEELDKLNEYLELNFDVQFNIGIGIHFGEVIIGEIGHPLSKQVTAIGDNVNLASRIEQLTKATSVKVLLSKEVKERVQDRIKIGKSFQAKIKGKTGLYHIFEALSLK
ncbi:adenylate/guanylate cyclase catalytic domain protein [Leptospira ryugenii]|uniref:Adenylate/guanylate cyclase catalytic domain protein n=1 Tax=Leptospira ryugenii TaxID=1917863 RepID=A0A2P2DYJ6_9LEPT|nr:adenylate/guanylate cyclase catalytic domain protein [Leptospira ryugenii]